MNVPCFFNCAEYFAPSVFSIISGYSWVIVSSVSLVLLMPTGVFEPVSPLLLKGLFLNKASLSFFFPSFISLPAACFPIVFGFPPLNSPPTKLPFPPDFIKAILPSGPK